MISKIFKPAIYTLLAMLSIQSYAHSQEMPAAKEKELEAKMQQMEERMKAMQAKLDTLKAKDSMNSFSTVYYSGKSANKAIKAPKIKLKSWPAPATMPPMPPLPPAALAQTLTQSFSSTFEGLNKSMNGNFSFSYDVSEKKLNERIKNGEAKEKIKNFSKSYSIGSGDELQIDNRFGSVTVNTWNKSEFKVDVTIRGIADADDEAQKMIDGVSISDSKNGSTVAVKTNLQSTSNHFWDSWSNNSRNSVHKLEVNYIIYMPSKNALTVTNRYGATNIPDFDGKLVVNSSYGSLLAKTLTNPDNEITCKYGNANIENLKGSDLNVAYGSLILGSSDNINATISYSSAKIAKIKTSGTINMKYGGGLRIGELDKNFKSLTINSSYSSVIVGLDNDPNFAFDINVRYGSFNYGDHNVSMMDKSTDDERGYNPSKSYKGRLGKGNADRLVTIKSSFGSVKFD